jgi:predicted nucleotide-binding protein (sugar kinase/HSP70/actin superfamily)
MEEKGRIGIPRALMFYRYFPLWQAFFEALGWKVIVSDGLRKGKIIYFEDSCLPMKLLVTHAIHLKDKVDHLFIPRLVSLHRKYIMCPKFRAAPDIVRLATEGRVSIIDETFDLRIRSNGLLPFFSKVGEKLGVSKKESKRAFFKAQGSFSTFQGGWMDRINRLPSRQLFQMDVPTPISPTASPPRFDVIGGVEGGGKEIGFPLRVALVGHPYNLYDTDINKDILALLKGLGMEIFTSDLLSEEEIDDEISDLSKEIYWSSGREIVGSLLHFLSGSVDGVIFLTSFKCGIDALLQEFIKRRLKIRGEVLIPLIVLSFDEHTGRDGLITRLEAFRDVIEQRRKEDI